MSDIANDMLNTQAAKDYFGATVNAYNQFANRVEISDYTADNILITPTNFSTSMSFNNDLVVTYDSNTLHTAKQNIGNNLVFFNYPNNNLYDYTNGFFTNNSSSDIIVTDLGMNVSGNMTYEGQTIVFQMNGTIEKGISMTSNMGNEYMPGFNFPDEVISPYESMDLNNFLPNQDFISIPGFSGQMDMELSLITTIGVFEDETTVYF